jgi:L-ascorbate metabolism protein UlaG (beta-lactamase superfamily)
MKWISVYVAAALLLAACAPGNPYYDPAKKHHRPDGFTNNYMDNATIGGNFWRWQWERLTQGTPDDRPDRVPVTRTDLAYLKANKADVTVTWLGHATALWQVGGLNILTDPHFTERASPLPFAGPKRLTKLPVALADLPRIDVVVISHNHYDHLDRPSVLALNKQAGGPPLFIVPLGMDLWLKHEGITNVQRLDWWDSREVGGAKVTLVPVQHWSARSLFDRHETLWGGYVVQAGGYSMFYAGDTGYSPDFRDIGARFGSFDFAQIPVGCSDPRWFMKSQHVDADEAMQIHLDVKSRFSLGVHWGVFRLCDDPIDTPLDTLPKARARHNVPDATFALFALGETRVLRKAP